MTPKDAIPDDLDFNPTISSLTALIGEELIYSLSSQLAGRRIYIPKKPGADSPLAVVIGLDAAEKISHVYGGTAFDVPVSAGIRAKIIQLHGDDFSNVAIAEKLKISRRTVQRVLGNRRDKNQMHLFDE